MSREPERRPEWLLALERLMGLLLVALAVQMFIEGLRVALRS
jgi:small neutral amino acid transporter SnatA (MarC family)